MASQILGLIPARGGSKSIPRKNLKMLGGKPLIAWTIQAALQSTELVRVVVSTEDEEIARVAQEWGADVPFMRPAEFAQDDSTSFSVVEHALGWFAAHENFSPEYVMVLQPTSPLRTTEDIDAVVRLARERNPVAVVSVSAATTHPFLCKRILTDSTLVDFIESDLSGARRQDLPQVFALNGALYLNRCDVLLRERDFVPQDALAYVMPQERSLDIDTPWDWRMVELILKDRYDPD